MPLQHHALSFFFLLFLLTCPPSGFSPCMPGGLSTSCETARRMLLVKGFPSSHCSSWLTCVCVCVQAVMAVADAVRAHKVSTLVVDPVLVATSGDSLAGSEVAQALKMHLFPLATIITPNLPEASALLGNRRVSDLETMKQASLIFHVFLGLVLCHASVWCHLPPPPCSLPKPQVMLCSASPCSLLVYQELLCILIPAAYLHISHCCARLQCQCVSYRLQKICTSLGLSMFSSRAAT